MKKKILDLLKGVKEWGLVIAFMVTCLGFLGNMAYGRIMAPKVKCQIEEEIKPYVEQIRKLEKRQDYLIFLVEQNLDKDRLGDLRRDYYMRKRNQEDK